MIYEALGSRGQGSVPPYQTLMLALARLAMGLAACACRCRSGVAAIATLGVSLMLLWLDVRGVLWSALSVVVALLPVVVAVPPLEAPDENSHRRSMDRVG